jgi:hypothetical protein
MKYRLIGAEKAQHPVSLLCEVLGCVRLGLSRLAAAPSLQALGL